MIVTPLIFHRCSCSKGECFDEKYSFEIFVKAYPYLDSILINDTIWFEINESTILKDLSSERMVNYDNALNLGSAIGVDELLGNSQRRDAAGDFNYILLAGTETSSVNPARFKEYLCKEVPNYYLFKLGIIPKKTGVFRMGFADAANVYRRNDDCTKAYFKILFKETNQHIYFNDQNFNITTPLPSNMYCFKVK